ncbi:outer membrane beta-barrel protein [Pontibacter cellulosilyticus]|uniref:Outer membrane beta-barrel protein n=1 Tax=Pontibacter cellulosilyticus TaxID=1720253 RepID=A0A923SI34_9BACT|nr:outer membrane beta-barrel protein [Pontibacter cellulosilyticus]MBC5992333.1 outer membrane beta-barrel protein [Pontibacter cellulosilyticus]
MKKIFLTACLGLLTQFCFAQLQKGTWTTTGTIGYSQSNDKKDALNDSQIKFERDYKSLQLLPSVGYFINDNVEVGLTGGYKNSEMFVKSTSVRLTEASTYGTESYSAGVYTRLYKFLSNNFALYGQANVNYISSDVSYLFEGENAFNKYMYANNVALRNVSVSISPGVSFFVHDRISLNAIYGALSYDKYNNDHKKEEMFFGQNKISEYSTSNYDLRLDLSSQSFNLGVSLYFR